MVTITRLQKKIFRNITPNTISVGQAKCNQMLLTRPPSQPIKCNYRCHGPIKLLEKHEVLNYPFLQYSSVMVFAVTKLHSCIHYYSQEYICLYLATFLNINHLTWMMNFPSHSQYFSTLGFSCQGPVHCCFLAIHLVGDPCQGEYSTLLRQYI